MDFFEVEQDPSWARSWFPGSPTRTDDGNSIDPRVFTRAEPYGGGPLHLPTKVRGPMRSITLGPFDAPILTMSAARKIAAFASSEEAQMVEVEADQGPLVVLNALRVIDCIDDSATRGTRWTAADHRSDKAGQYRMIVHLFIDPSKVDGVDIFRLKGWMTPLIVSSRVVDALGQDDIAGVKLIPVVQKGQ